MPNTAERNPSQMNLTSCRFYEARSKSVADNVFLAKSDIGREQAAINYDYSFRKMFFFGADSFAILRIGLVLPMYFWRGVSGLEGTQ